MTDKDLFLTTLSEKFKDLQKTAIENKYRVLVPLKKFVTDSMLDKNYYDNHIFFISKFDENMYINLNGKALKLEKQKFIPYLGWKKSMKNMEFNVKDQFTTSQGLSCSVVDNEFDEQSYDPKAQTQDKDINQKRLQRFMTMKEYLDYYTTKHFYQPEFAEALDNFDHVTNILRNNYIFIQRYEDEYSSIFLRETKSLTDSFKTALGGKRDDAFINMLTLELIDSLVFNKMYEFIFGSLIAFNRSKEEEMKEKLKDNPNKFDLSTLQIDKAYRECKFEKAKSELRKISCKQTVFEKIVKYFL